MRNISKIQFDVEKENDKQVIVLSEETKERITGDLFEGLYRKRQIGFGKLFKTIKKELDLDDVEDGNLVQTGEDSQEVSRGQENCSRFGIGRERIIFYSN